VVVLLLAVTSVFATGLATVYAQPKLCSDPIIPGGWCSGELNYEYPARYYQFYGYAGDYVSISMERDDYSPRLDPYLELKDPYGYIVASDDDSLGKGNSWINNYRLRSAGMHTIIARSYNNQTFGEFWLYLMKP
jgi:hypothetical protein